jgi:glycosyltransferase involved in cell wall biosynthesis
LDHPKNEDWLLDLAVASRTKIGNLRLLLAGEGPNETTLRQRIQRQGLADRVRLLGHQLPLPLFHAADALLLPSEREGFSLACAEAMCAGLPVLRTRTSGTAELIVEGVTGRSVAIDQQAFLDAAIDFLSDGQVLSAMGVAAAEHIRRNFRFEVQVEQTVELYRRLAASPEKMQPQRRRDAEETAEKTK